MAKRFLCCVAKAVIDCICEEAPPKPKKRRARLSIRRVDDFCLEPSAPLEPEVIMPPLEVDEEDGPVADEGVGSATPDEQGWRARPVKRKVLAAGLPAAFALGALFLWLGK